jgi:hypothetical protein
MSVRAESASPILRAAQNKLILERGRKNNEKEH